MPSCMLRVSGTTEQVRTFLAATSLQPVRVFWEGEPGMPKSRGPIKVSGFNIALSEADGLPAQAQQATEMIRTHLDAFVLIKNLGLTAATLDFGLYDLATEERPWPTYRLPIDIIQLAAQLGWNIELSFYGPAQDAP